MTVSPNDAKIIIQFINNKYNTLNPVAKLIVPPISAILNDLPDCAKKYTLQDLIDLIQQEHQNGNIP